MENYFTEEFKLFFETLNDFEKKLILWCSVSNYECPQNYFLLVFKSVEIAQQIILYDNYCHKFHVEKQPLHVFDDKQVEYLKNKLEELDGTLLLDVVWGSLKTHKIFKNI